ncbi:ankyrin repeat domain-containing protein [Shewanella glacialipiscicola]|uniref:ankyrin repeat domain-containing protein n=1 Tax=Shewanella glacialipiscicola TaxID=614069 RepID=UPI003D7BD2B0
MDDTNTLFKKLIQAIRACDENTVATLIERGVDIEQDGNRALMVACQLGYTSIVKCLIEADANIHQNNNEALWLAVTHRHAAVTVVLMAQGADHMDREGVFGKKRQNHSHLKMNLPHLSTSGLRPYPIWIGNFS